MRRSARREALPRALEVGVYAGIGADAAEWLHEEDVAARVGTLADVERGRVLVPSELDAEPTAREARLALELQSARRGGRPPLACLGSRRRVSGR